MNEIEQLLLSYPPDCRPIRVEPLGSAGGMSGAQFWRIDAPRGKLALRRWPTEHPSPKRLRFIHAVLNYACEHGISFLPVPVATNTSHSFVEHSGHLWEITPWLPGIANYERSPTTEKLCAAMTALAQFHLATADFRTPPTPLSVGRQAECLPATSAPAIVSRLTRLQQLAHGGIQELARAITDTIWPDLAPLARQFIAALPRAIPRAVAQLEPLANVPLPVQPCIRDIWHDHVLFIGNEVTGLVDFGALDIDTPATDIARLLGSLVSNSPPHFGEGLGEGQCAFNPWRTGLDAYSAQRPLSQHESLAVVALDAASPILAGINWLRWLYIERRQFENHAQVIERFRQITAHELFPQPRSGEIT